MKFFERLRQLNRMSFFNKNLGKSQRYTLNNSVGLASPTYSLFSCSTVTQNAFTLAEVLITLGIIGVIAAMTLPSLINNINDMQYKTAYKKAFSVASQAWSSASANNELLSLPSSGNNLTERLTNFAAFQKYFNVSKSCWDTTNLTAANISSCWADGELWWKWWPTLTGAAFIDNSGMSWVLADAANNTNGVSDIIVDINGLKSPNKLGQDRFVMLVRANDGNSYDGDLTRIKPLDGDCNKTDCKAATNIGTTFDYVCPSVASHPCYYTSWLTGGGK